MLLQLDNQELTYRIIGILIKIHNLLGPSLQEKHYQRAVEQELINQQINYEKEKEVKIMYNSKIIGKYYLDFVIEDKVVLELKTIYFLDRKSQNQVLGYLNSLQLKIALLANFRKSKLEFKRIILPDKYLKSV